MVLFQAEVCSETHGFRVLKSMPRYLYKAEKQKKFYHWITNLLSSL